MLFTKKARASPRFGTKRCTPLPPHGSGNTIRPRVPLREIHYLPTLRCNCRCLHCGQTRTDSDAGEISAAFLAERLLESGYVFADTQIIITGGEPFLKRDLADFYVPFIKQKPEHPISITTNGTCTAAIRDMLDRIPPYWYDRLVFAVSIEGPEHTHNCIRNNKNAFAAAIETLQLLRSRNIHAAINTVIQKDNIGELDVFANYVRETFQDTVQISFIPILPDYATDKSIPFDDEYAGVCTRYISSLKDRKYLASGGALAIQDCHAGVKNIAISPEGDVYTCLTGMSYKGRENAHQYRMGSLRNESLDAILDGAGAARALDAAKHCSCRNYCEITRENAYFGLSFDLTAAEQHRWLRLTGSPYSTGRGWHSNERQPPELWQWSAEKEAFIHFDNRARDIQQIVLELRNGYPENDAAPLTLTVFVNGAERQEGHCSGGMNRVAIDAVPPTDVVDITLRTDKLWRPHDYGINAADMRLLGLALTGIGIVK